MLGPQGFQVIKNDELDIIIRLPCLDSQFDLAGGRVYSIVENMRLVLISRGSKPLIAAGFCVRIVSVVAASYLRSAKWPREVQKHNECTWATHSKV